MIKHVNTQLCSVFFYTDYHQLDYILTILGQQKYSQMTRQTHDKGIAISSPAFKKYMIIQM